jgi:putative ABC transport system ATP-binding protein
MSDQESTSDKITAQSVIALRQAGLSFNSTTGQVDILHQIDLDIPAGQTVAILGPSGAGKTSLLMIMAGLEALSSGKAYLNGQNITQMNEDQLAQLRRDHVGIVFQAFRLIPSMTALQNVAVPLELSGDRQAHEKATAALKALGLGHRLDHLPDQLSGGEQQRVAIARAIVTRPRILLADEPTGNLDSTTGATVITELFAAAESVGAALVLITHDEGLAQKCQRLLRIEDGRLIFDQQLEGLNS